MSMFDKISGFFGRGQLPPAPPAPAPAPAPAMVTPALLGKLGVRADLAATWAPHIATACAKHSIDTRMRLAAFLANILHESGHLAATVESLNYTPEALVRQWPSHFTPALAQQLGRTADHPANQELIAEHAYGGRMGNGPVGSGDGWKYRGRGFGITGKSNYVALATKIGVPLADLPTLLQMPAGAAETAAAFWEVSVCNIVADRGDIAGVRRIFNGGLIGLDQVQALYKSALVAMPA